MTPIDEARRALSNGLIFSPHISFQSIENCKKLLKTYGSQVKPVAIRPQTGPKPMNDIHR